MSGEGGESSPPDWPAIYRGLSEQYGWTPEEIGRLTQYQALAYLNSETVAPKGKNPAALAAMAEAFGERNPRKRRQMLKQLSASANKR